MQSLGIWDLREEARKSRDHILSDVLVYLAETGDGQLESFGHKLAESYLRGDSWLDIHWTKRDPRKGWNAHYNAIVEVVNQPISIHPSSSGNSEATAIDRYCSVLVDIPELVKLPEGMRAKGVRSVIGLKRIQYECDCGWKEGSLTHVTGVAVADGKIDPSRDPLVCGNRLGEKVDQIPSQLVKCGAKAVDKISSDERNILSDGSSFDYEVVPNCLRVVFFSDRVRVAFDPPGDLFLKGVEVSFRPSGLHVNILN